MRLIVNYKSFDQDPEHLDHDGRFRRIFSSANAVLWIWVFVFHSLQCWLDLLITVVPIYAVYVLYSAICCHYLIVISGFVGVYLTLLYAMKEEEPDAKMLDASSITRNTMITYTLLLICTLLCWSQINNAQLITVNEELEVTKYSNTGVGGFMFNVQATSRAVTINSILFDFAYDYIGRRYGLWYKQGSFVGYNNNESAWTLAVKCITVYVQSFVRLYSARIGLLLAQITAPSVPLSFHQVAFTAFTYTQCRECGHSKKAHHFQML